MPAAPEDEGVTDRQGRQRLRLRNDTVAFAAFRVPRIVPSFRAPFYGGIKIFYDKHLGHSIHDWYKDGTCQNDIMFAHATPASGSGVFSAGSIVYHRVRACQRATCRRGERRGRPRFFGVRPPAYIERGPGMPALSGGACMVAEGSQRNLGGARTRELLAEAGRRPAPCAWDRA